MQRPLTISFYVFCAALVVASFLLGGQSEHGWQIAGLNMPAIDNAGRPEAPAPVSASAESAAESPQRPDNTATPAPAATTQPAAAPGADPEAPSAQAVAEAEPPASGETQPSAVAGTDAEPAAPGAAASIAPKESPPPDPAKPQFDIVRVDENGEALVAGRAAPGQELEILANGEVIARATADPDGAFLAIPEKPLSAGQHAMTVRRAGAPAGETSAEQQVAVVIPAQAGGAGDVASAGSTGAVTAAPAGPSAGPGQATAQELAASATAENAPAAAVVADSGAPAATATPPAAAAAAAPAVTVPAGAPAAPDSAPSGMAAAAKAAPPEARPESAEASVLADAQQAASATQGAAPAASTVRAPDLPDTGSSPAGSAPPPASQTAAGKPAIAQAPDSDQPVEAEQQVASAPAPTAQVQTAGSVPEEVAAPAEASRSATAESNAAPGNAAPNPDVGSPTGAPAQGTPPNPSPEQQIASAPTVTELPPSAPAASGGGAEADQAIANGENVEAPVAANDSPGPSPAPASNGAGPVPASTVADASQPTSETPPAEASPPQSSEAAEASAAAREPVAAPGENTAVAVAGSIQPAGPAGSATVLSELPGQDSVDDNAAAEPASPPAAEVATRVASNPAVPESRDAVRAQPGLDTAAAVPNAPAGNAVASTIAPESTAGSEPKDVASVAADNPGGEQASASADAVATGPIADGSSAKPEPKEAAAAPVPAAPELSVQAVETEGDSLYVAGAAAPDSTVRVFVEDDLVGEVRTGAGGEWLLETEKQIPAGQVTIRADQIGVGEQPLATSEAPFVRYANAEALVPGTLAASSGTVDAVPANPVSGPPVVIIRRGDNLWRISRRNYGKGIRYKTIFQANRDQIRRVSRIYPGQVFVLPAGDRNWTGKAPPARTQ